MSALYSTPVDDVEGLRRILREQTPSFVTPGGLKHWPAVTRLDACLTAAQDEAVQELTTIVVALIKGDITANEARAAFAVLSDPARDDGPEKPEHEWRTPPRDFTDHIMDTGV
jgi:hypothetical protein